MKKSENHVIPNFLDEKHRDLAMFSKKHYGFFIFSDSCKNLLKSRDFPGNCRSTLEFSYLFTPRLKSLSELLGFWFVSRPWSPQANSKSFSIFLDFFLFFSFLSHAQEDTQPDRYPMWSPEKACEKPLKPFSLKSL